MATFSPYVIARRCGAARALFQNSEGHRREIATGVEPLDIWGGAPHGFFVIGVRNCHRGDKDDAHVFVIAVIECVAHKNMKGQKPQCILIEQPYSTMLSQSMCSLFEVVVGYDEG